MKLNYVKIFVLKISKCNFFIFNYHQLTNYVTVFIKKYHNHGMGFFLVSTISMFFKIVEDFLSVTFVLMNFCYMGLLTQSIKVSFQNALRKFFNTFLMLFFYIYSCSNISPLTQDSFLHSLTFLTCALILEM